MNISSPPSKRPKQMKQTTLCFRKSSTTTSTSSTSTSTNLAVTSPPTTSPVFADISIQTSQQRYVAALAEIDDTVSILNAWREEAISAFHSLFCELTEKAEAIGVTLSCPRLAKRSVYRHNAMPGGDNDIIMDAEAYYRINVFAVALDEVVADISARFADHQRKSLMLHYVLPDKIVAPSASFDDISSVVDRYASFLNNSVAVIHTEYLLWQQLWKRRVQKNDVIPKTAIAAINTCPASIYPNIFKLLQILATLPVSTAEPERIFSKVEHTLTDIRSSMSEERLEALILLQAHRDRVLQLDTQTIINRFASFGSRRLPFVLNMQY